MTKMNGYLGMAHALAIAEAAIRKDRVEIARSFEPAACAELSFQSAQDQIADATLASIPEQSNDRT